MRSVGARRAAEPDPDGCPMRPAALSPVRRLPAFV